MEAPTQSGGVAPRLSQVLARRIVVAVVLIVTLYVPVVVFAVISGEPSVSAWAMIAGVAVLQNLMFGGRTIAYLTVGLLTALTPIAIVSGAVPVAGTALMAIMCFWVGLSATKGLHRGMLLIPIYLAFLIIAPPPWSGLTGDDRTSTSYLLWNMLFWGGGALWAALVLPPVLRQLKMPPRLPPGAPWPRVDAVIYTITITVLCTASTLAVLIWWPGSDGAWLVLTVLAVTTEPGAHASVKKTLARIGGTVVGVAIAASLGSVIDSDAVLLAVGGVLAVILVVIALTPHTPYFLWALVLTPTVVLFSATSIADVDTTDAERLAFTLLGGALVLLASGIALGWAHYQQAHDIPEPISQT